jgi:NADPH:quinone reductase-like Zn-dependent oxidoreductase
LLKSLQIAHSKKATVSRVNFNTSVESVGIKENDRVLIHAGSGGVGSFAIQYAKVKGLLYIRLLAAKM